MIHSLLSVILNVQVHWVEELYAYGNRISQLPHEVCNLKKLRKLALNENLLATLPGEIVDSTVQCSGGGVYLAGTRPLPLPTVTIYSTRYSSIISMHSRGKNSRSLIIVVSVVEIPLTPNWDNLKIA